MQKEKLGKAYRKPDLSLICPKKIVYQMTPSEILSKNMILFQPILQHKSSQLKRIQTLQTATCISWFNANQRIKSKKYLEQQFLPEVKQKQGFSSDVNFQEKRKDSSFRQQHGEEKKHSLFKKREKQGSRRLVIGKRSPYVRNRQDYERILNHLKPIKGPTDSVINQIKRHNDLHKKNAQNILLATKQSFKQKIMKYSTRIGLKNNEKIFIMNSKDSHIREALLKNGWVQSEDLTSTFFHLKWVYTDCVSDYSRLQQGQFYNHFKNNQQLTNKNLFRKNIEKASKSIKPNYPQTFDLQVGDNLIKFELEYIKYEYFSVLGGLVQLIKDNLPEIYKKYTQLWLTKDSQKLMTIKKLRQKDFISIFEPKNYHSCQNSQNRVTSHHQLRQLKQLRQMMYYFCFNLQDFYEEDKRVKGSRSQLTSPSQLNSKNKVKKNCLILNPQLTTVLKILKNKLKEILKQKCKIQRQLDTNNQQSQDNGNSDTIKIFQHLSPKQKFSTMTISHEMNNSYNTCITNLKNVLINDRFVAFHLLNCYEKLKGQFIHNAGINNWWIIKPAGVSRGSGIKIQSQITKIIINKYGKIVQKYIQRPLLLSCGRKFDLRQWVLVKSFFPLQVYLFESCYSRFSSTKYQDSNFESLAVHLTNFSQHKQTYKKQGNSAASIMSEQEICQQIQKITFQGKWKIIKSEIKQQILKSLKCCQFQIEDQSSCFQVFGFDILLDQSFKPWILEVNLSPACEKRSPFLERYLQKMAQGIIDFLQGREIRHWQKLESAEESEDKYVIQCSEEQKAAIKIQKAYKKYLANKQKKNAEKVSRQLDRKKQKPSLKLKSSKKKINIFSSSKQKLKQPSAKIQPFKQQATQIFESESTSIEIEKAHRYKKKSNSDFVQYDQKERVIYEQVY